MSEASQLIENFADKVGRLLDSLELERASRKNLEDQNVQLETKLTAQQEKLVALEEDIRQLKLANGLLSGSDAGKDARASINEIVREIDRCIALLNE
jgi:septation ring formation regulator EzrA